MRIFSLIVVSSVVLSGCGMLAAEPGKEGPPGKDGAKGEAGPPGLQALGSTRDGERLKARYFVSDDGAQTPIGWLDAEIDQPCAFVTAADGHYRCLPVVPHSEVIRVFYSDNTCAFDAVAVGVEHGGQPCAELGSYVDDTRHGECGDVTVVYSVGPTFTGPHPGFYSDGVGCVPVDGKTFDFFKLTSVEPSAFVGASVKIK